MDYATIELASEAALTAAYECGHQDYECGGVIYEWPDGRFTFSRPITDHKPFGVTIPYLYSVPPPAGARVAADFHTHACLPQNWRFAPFFSFADANVNDGFHIIGYMLDTCSGLVHRYAPGADDRDDEEVDFVPHADGTVHPPLYLTVGHISGWINLSNVGRYRKAPCDQS